ncbi:hypothetical protein DJ68_10550 [Halorubrum sp. C3]|nr:hypothetical protein DJ68_10550 [Halorubrum sp. C3]
MSEDITLDEFVNDESNSDVSEEALMTSLDETSVGHIPSDWSTVRLGDLTENTLYGANESAEDYDPNKPRYIRIKDIDERGRLKGSEKASLSSDKAEGYLLKEGDMLFARSGSPGRTYLHRDDEGEYCYGGYSIKHELVSEGLNHEYLSQYTKSQKYWDWIERIARTGAQANINSREYASLLVPIPPLPEQRKIATVLYTIDQAIEKTNELIDQIERVRAGTAQDLFRYGTSQRETQDSWLGEIPENWNIVQFSEIVESNRNGLYKSKDAYGEGCPIAKMGNALEKRVLDMSSADRLELTEEEKEKYGLNEGDLIFARRAQEVSAAGDCCYVPELDELTVFESSLIRVRLSEEANPEFYTQYFDSPVGSRSIDRIVTETSISGIATGDLLDLKVAVPSLGEQKEIADIMWQFDDQEKVLKKEKAQYERLKRGLMQDLLSGTVRTTDTNIEVPEEVAQYG